MTEPLAIARQYQETPMTCVRSLVDLKRTAAHSRCRIKQWLLTHEEARRLAAGMAWEGSPSILYEAMCAGQVRILGAMVHVR